MLKKLFSSCIAFVMLISLLSSGVFAAVGDEIIIGVNDPGFSVNTPVSGGWDAVTGLTGYNGTATKFHTYISGQTAEYAQQAYVRWTPTITEAGRYDVYIWRVGNANNATYAAVKVMSKDGLYETVIEQSKSDSGWYKLGNFNFEAGTSGYAQFGIHDNSTIYYRVNCAKFVKTEDAPAPTVDLVTPASLSSVDTKTTVELKFGLPMNEDFMTDSYITLTEKESGNKVAVEEFDVVTNATSTTVVITPKSRLSAKTVYDVTVSGDVESAAGTKMGEDKTWSFTTTYIIYETVTVTTDDGAPYYTETGSWAASGLAGYSGGSRYTGAVGAKATFKTELSAGTYLVYFYRVVHAGNATVAPLNIYHANGVESRRFNGTVGGSSGWVDYGSFEFADGEATITIELDEPGLIVRTSAVMFQKVGDRTSPKAELVSPKNLTNIAFDSNFEIKFSEPMNVKDIDTDITLIEKNSSVSHACDITYDATSKIATVTPVGNLKAGTEYVLAIGNSLCDLADHIVIGTKSWTFKTYPIKYADFALKDKNGEEVKALAKGETFTASVTLTNDGETAADTILIYGLYDDEGALEIADFEALNLKEGDADKVNTLEIPLPDKDLTGYTLKVMFWDSFELLNPYAEPIIIG